MIKPIKNPLKQKKINILGVAYALNLNISVEKEPRLKNADGFMDFSTKEIYLAKFEKDEMSISDIENFKKKVLRHEIIHAFLYESGLHSQSSSAQNWATNEEMIDWLAIQWHKISDIFEKLGI